MDITLILVVTAFVAIVVGVGVYKHYKKKARLLAQKLPVETPEVEAPKSGSAGGGSKNTHVAQQIK